MQTRTGSNEHDLFTAIPLIAGGPNDRSFHLIV